MTEICDVTARRPCSARSRRTATLLLGVILLLVLGQQTSATPANCSAGLGTFSNPNVTLRERLLFTSDAIQPPLPPVVVQCLGLSDVSSFNYGTAVLVPGSVPDREALQGNGESNIFLGDKILDVGSNDFSISLWFTPSTESDDTTLISDDVGTGQVPSSYVYLKVVAGSLYFATSDAERLYAVSVSGGSGMQATTDIQRPWFHAVAVRQGATHRIYVNGKLVSEAVASGIANLVGNSATLFGQAADNLNYHTGGLLDDVRVYSGALSASDVRSVFMATHSAVNSISTFTWSSIRIDNIAGPISKLRLEYEMRYNSTYTLTASVEPVVNGHAASLEVVFGAAPGSTDALQAGTINITFLDSTCDLTGDYVLTMTPTCSEGCPRLPPFTYVATIDPKFVACDGSRTQKAIEESVPTFTLTQLAPPGAGYLGDWLQFQLSFSGTRTVYEVQITDASVVLPDRPEGPWKSRVVVANSTVTPFGLAVGFPADLSPCSSLRLLGAVEYSCTDSFPRVFVNAGSDPASFLLELAGESTTMIQLELRLRVFYDNVGYDWSPDFGRKKTRDVMETAVEVVGAIAMGSVRVVPRSRRETVDGGREEAVVSREPNGR